MSYSPTTYPTNRLTERLEAGINRVKPATDDEESGISLRETAKELFDVIESTDALLQTIDLDALPDVIDVEELPNLVDLGRLSDAIKEHDPDLSVDLSHLERVINERELWNSVDLLEFGKAKQRLGNELKDVVGEDTLDGIGSDSEAVADAKTFASSLRRDAREVLVQQEAVVRGAAVRDGVVERHAALERNYASNKIRFENATQQRAVRNPTAVSLLPQGPLPNSVSTRLSTIPSVVRHAKIDALPRLFGSRWRNARSKRPP